jgi:uncharacterized protein YjbI with pentapeptide repeats
MADKDKKIDPFDVEALEKSLNDSATRVSTIWVSFLIFSLYLLTAATTVTHRQLFLAEPVKLPVLNIDLPLWGFFFLAPILFVILHAYVLLQVVLLARTAAAYNEAIKKVADRDGLSNEENASLRQRLANTLFAQILAGSPREREGAFGWLLNAMAWITLAIAPILILLTFQFMFLPYHSHLATWAHRVLILLEFALAFQLWPLVLRPDRDFRWPNFRWRPRETAGHLLGLLGPSGDWRNSLRGLSSRVIPFTSTLLFVLISLSLASFPGEPHVNIFTGQSVDHVQCRRWINQKFDFADLRFDRLVLPQVNAVDRATLEKIEQATSKDREQAHLGERTRVLRERDFNCGDFYRADLRRVDLSGARLRNADLDDAKLSGASFFRAEVQGARLNRAQLQGSSLAQAKFQGASFSGAQLQGADLDDIELQGASLGGAQLQGASLDLAQLQGAGFAYANLQGAWLAYAQLQGASLEVANLQGAILNLAQLQGASLDFADFRGASLLEAELQGARLRGASLDHADLRKALIWRTRNVNCRNARVKAQTADAVIAIRGEFDRFRKPIVASDEAINQFIASSVAEIPEERAKESVSERLRAGLVVPDTDDDSAVVAEAWRQCEIESNLVPSEQFDQEVVTMLRGLVCSDDHYGPAIARGIAREWFRMEFNRRLIRALLGEDGGICKAEQSYNQATRQQLRDALGRPRVSSPASN